MRVVVQWTGEETPRLDRAGLAPEQARSVAAYRARKLAANGYRVRGNERTGWTAREHGVVVARIRIEPDTR